MSKESLEFFKNSILNVYPGLKFSYDHLEKKTGIDIMLVFFWYPGTETRMEEYIFKYSSKYGINPYVTYIKKTQNDKYNVEVLEYELAMLIPKKILCGFRLEDVDLDEKTKKDLIFSLNFFKAEFKRG